jgi:hypothetical protein
MSFGIESCTTVQVETLPATHFGMLRFGWLHYRQLHWKGKPTMAKKSRLTRVAVGIGAAVGKADRTAHKVAKAGVLAKKELKDISKQIDALKRQLQKTTKRLRQALS